MKNNRNTFVDKRWNDDPKAVVVGKVKVSKKRQKQIKKEIKEWQEEHKKKNLSKEDTK